MFGIFDPQSVNRHDRSIDFVAISGERHVVSLRSPEMVDTVRECVKDQFNRKVTAVEIKPLENGKVTLTSAGIALFSGTLERRGDEHLLHCARVDRSGIRVRHEAVFPVDFEGEVIKLPEAMIAAVEGHIVNGRIKGFRAAVFSMPAPQPENLPAAE